MSDEPTVYLAASYSRLHEIQGYRDELRAIGYRVKARWVDGEHEAIDGIATVEQQRAFADDDVEDIWQSNVFLHFTTGEPSRGGSHTEFGMALMKRKFEAQLGQRETLILRVGPRQHVFHSRDEVMGFDDWNACYDWMIRYIRMAERGVRL